MRREVEGRKSKVEGLSIALVLLVLSLCMGVAAEVQRPPTEAEHIAAMKKEASAPRPTKTHRWVTTNHADRFDDQPRYKAFLKAEGRKDEKEIWLYIDVHGAKADLYINTPEYLGFEDVEVTSRVDDRPAATGRWNVSTGQRAAFAPKKMDLIGQLLDAETLLVKIVPEFRDPMVLKFEVRGLRDAAPDLVKAFAQIRARN